MFWIQDYWLMCHRRAEIALVFATSSLAFFSSLYCTLLFKLAEQRIWQGQVFQCQMHFHCLQSGSLISLSLLSSLCVLAWLQKSQPGPESDNRKNLSSSRMGIHWPLFCIALLGLSAALGTAFAIIFPWLENMCYSRMPRLFSMSITLWSDKGDQKMVEADIIVQSALKNLRAPLGILI